ncbi:hypothetical protein ACZ11_08280 [Lysinibacillus xylanilyticus]|uniref:Uncharacterized protein n=1 Tax=Lysinibacillus xylanilyticus TaxID=582475 RepID=A0A0K9FD36_9BACI|nr:hypothetical protein ACZ11_08280 [Lysinibacillus xylanilyticus]
MKSSKSLLIESISLIHFLFLKGNSIGAYNKILKIYGKDIFIQTLSRDNTLANAMKFEVVSND